MFQPWIISAAGEINAQWMRCVAKYEIPPSECPDDEAVEEIIARHYGAAKQ